MSPPPRSRRLQGAATPVPAFFLYGEPLQPPDERLIHVETIASRSSLHNWHIHPHRHRDLHQVLLLQHGRAGVTLDGRTWTLRPPLTIVVPPGVVHAFHFEPDTVGLVTSFAPALARDFGGSTPGLPDFLERPAALALEREAADATDLFPLSDMLVREFARSATGRHGALRGLLAALLPNLLRVSQASRTADERAETTAPVAVRARELVARLRQLIERRYREHAAIADLASELGSSEARLRRACLAATGQSPIELVHLRLVIEAERQLRYTSMSIAQVAYFLGFDDPAYFSRFFTQRMGQSPRAFRATAGAELD